MRKLPDHNSIFDVYAYTDIYIVIHNRCQTVFAASLAQHGSSIIFENGGGMTLTIAGIFMPSPLIVDMRLEEASVVMVSNVSNGTIIVQLMNITNEPIMISP